MTDDTKHIRHQTPENTAAPDDTKREPVAHRYSPREGTEVCFICGFHKRDHAPEHFADAKCEPNGFAILTSDGHFVGIWRDREIAEKIVNRSPSAKGERIVEYLPRMDDTKREPVAWQRRFIDSDEGPSRWIDCPKGDLEFYARQPDYEVRALVPADTIARLEQELRGMEQLLTFAENDSAQARQRAVAAEGREAKLREVLRWYADEAAAIARNMAEHKDGAVLASVTVIKLDAGRRAQDALLGGSNGH